MVRRVGRRTRTPEDHAPPVVALRSSTHSRGPVDPDQFFTVTLTGELWLLWPDAS